MRNMQLLIPAALVAAAAFARPSFAQDLTGRCATPDSIAIRGLARVTDATARGNVGLQPGSPLSTPVIQRAVRGLYGSGQFEPDIRVSCDVDPAASRATLVFEVRERPLLAEVEVAGASALSARSVRDKVELVVGQPVDPALVARAVQRIDSTYEKSGYYLARVQPETTMTAAGRARIVFRIDEGRRLAVSGVRIDGNRAVSDKTVVSAMETKPEGFFWFRRGEFDETKYAGDLGERIPDLYASKGFIDFQVVKDTLRIDRERGKAFVDVSVIEGPRYKIGDFEVVNNRRFSSEEIARYYPFADQSPTLTERVTGLIRRSDRTPEGVFDRARWQAATERVQTAYRNEGYIYASINPVVERTVGPDSVPQVNLRWEIDEGSPAIINRIEIAGNDYTSEECIRQQLSIIPGSVFNQDLLLSSWQRIGNLGFFEAPLPFPDTRRVNESGDIDVIFRVKEKRTGSINFGASAGGSGVGLGGFISVEQPNLFGLCKRGSINANFGGYANDFSATYSDPALRNSRVSGTVSAYRSQSRYQIIGIGNPTRTGASVRLGFPVPGSYFSRFSVSYNGESATFSQLNSGTTNDCTQNCFRSNLGGDFTNDTRGGLPFATSGGLRTLTADFSGGPLGGTVSFQRYTGEFRSYAPLWQFGGGQPGAQPKQFVLGLTGRAGALFGNAGPFFFQQQFALGGVQFGQALRGYPEFSITPAGFDPRASQTTSRPESFGNAFLTLTAEVGLRFNQSFYVNAFYDAGNNYSRATQFNPTRLFRGAGVGLATVTPLGPLGLDWAYGFDRIDMFGRPDPKWQLHFKLGQLF